MSTSSTVLAHPGVCLPKDSKGRNSGQSLRSMAPQKQDPTRGLCSPSARARGTRPPLPLPRACLVRPPVQSISFSSVNNCQGK